MGATKIEWTDSVWNPVAGCTPVSSGCANCYARRMATRLRGRYGYPADEPFRVTLHPERLDEPLRWRKRRRIFVSSMGDLLHEDVPWGWWQQIQDAMLVAPQHTYMMLTKRPERLIQFAETFVRTHCEPMPDNWWLGTTCEDQNTADERIPHLLRCPAAVRFVSLEPLLGPVTFRWAAWSQPTQRPGGITIEDHLDGLRGLDWIIAGGETGPGARPAHPDWFRTIRDQCQAAGVPFFFKQISKTVTPPEDLLIREFPNA